MILIALGANLPSRYGPPEETLVRAQKELEEKGVKRLAASKTWLTRPVPPSGQPLYRNAVIAVETSLAPLKLLDQLKKTEKKFGRYSDIKNAARCLDLDILAYHDMVSDKPELTLPHPRLHQRGFVLYPLSEIAPGWVHPVSGQSVAEMIESLPEDQTLSEPYMRPVS